MLPGLVNSALVDAAVPTRPTIQGALFQDDTEARIAELEKQLAQERAYYDALTDEYQHLQEQMHQERQRSAALEQRLAICHEAMMGHGYSRAGVIRR